MPRGYWCARCINSSSRSRLIRVRIAGTAAASAMIAMVTANRTAMRMYPRSREFFRFVEWLFNRLARRQRDDLLVVVQHIFNLNRSGVRRSVDAHDPIAPVNDLSFFPDEY